MKKNFKTIIIAILALVLLTITVPRVAFTIGLPSDSKVFSATEFEELMGGVYKGQSFSTRNYASFKLSTIFADREYALNTIKKTLKSFLSELSIKYSLSEFSAETISDYNDALLEYRESDFQASHGRPPYKLTALSYFIETYTNSETNKETIEWYKAHYGMEAVRGSLYKDTSTGYITTNDSLGQVILLVSDMLEYMKTEFDLDLLTEGTLSQYKARLRDVPEDFSFQKNVFEEFIKIYTNNK